MTHVSKIPQAAKGGLGDFYTSKNNPASYAMAFYAFYAVTAAVGIVSTLWLPFLRLPPAGV